MNLNEETLSAFLREAKMIKPILVKGKYNEAFIFAKAVEMNAEDKIRQFLDHPLFADTKVRIMPDVHIGKGTVVGFTATANSLIVPSIVGVDIGCGVCAYNLGKGNLRFDKLDIFIKKNIPSGMDVHTGLHEGLDNACEYSDYNKGSQLKNALRKLCEKQGYSPERVFASLGTLGGGNHFIEVDVDEEHNRWLLVHTGSRILGARTAEYHEISALKETPDKSPIKYLSGTLAEEYLDDMWIVQNYAAINRLLIAMDIAEGFFKVNFSLENYRDTVHNYYDFEDKVIRKGAISAREGQKVIIPFSMSEGAVLGTGKGNTDWNNSAPHGAGRKISRTQARGLSLDEYRKQMRGIWSSSVGEKTLEECPMAYKRSRDILDFIPETVIIDRRLKPVYNFKTEK
jgi:RNA-splicing ligase RtcB